MTKLEIIATFVTVIHITIIAYNPSSHHHNNFHLQSDCAILKRISIQSHRHELFTMKPIVLVLTAEHAVNTIPQSYQNLFQNNPSVLETHDAMDFGTRAIAGFLHQNLVCEYHHPTVSRLLIDCNHHVHHPQLFSEFSHNLLPSEKQHLIDTYYLPFRNHTEQTIQKHIDNGEQVLHLSIHSFAPSARGVVHNAAIGLLYDFRRHAEKEVARAWYRLLCAEPPGYRVRLNYPYSGANHGFPHYLRKKHPESDYLGFHVETNQALLTDQTSLMMMTEALHHSINELLVFLA